MGLIQDQCAQFWAHWQVESHPISLSLFALVLLGVKQEVSFTDVEVDKMVILTENAPCRHSRRVGFYKS